MDILTALLDHISLILASKAIQNAVDAASAGLFAAFFFGRKHPAKLFCSAAVAGFAGFMWGSVSCQIVMETVPCSPEGRRAFSAAIGAISWPLFLFLARLPGFFDEAPEILKRWVGKK